MVEELSFQGQKQVQMSKRADADKMGKMYKIRHFKCDWRKSENEEIRKIFNKKGEMI